ncbi:Uncharacterised protein [Serratia fonticola]|uniref:hypothetical protein n=1 Tax=Serratia fonticola TaxID=47917 RepID=UPI0021836B8C|nr:hypothetical protein [Serratia fonticola]CAI2041058.1 Uncharacterised protein [Serratia fonticola]
MKNRFKSVISLSMTLLAFAASAETDTNVMSCQLQNGSAVRVTWDGNYLKYAYGKPAKNPEIELPNPPNELKNVHFGTVSFASSEAVYYRFSNGNYDYVTYFTEQNDSTVSNLGIFNDKKLIKQIKCKGYFKTELANIYQPVSSKIKLDDPNESMDWVVNE